MPNHPASDDPTYSHVALSFSSLAFTPTPQLHTAHERRELCCLFADLVGSTALAARLSLEDYAALMTQLTDWLQLELQTYGALLCQAQGDAVIALWDSADVAQAQYAALCLHEGISQLEPARRHGLKLQLRVGLACGPILLSEHRTLSSSYGLPLNLARRLCSAAQPGQTLLCNATAQHLPAARLHPASYFELVGFQQPVAAHVLKSALLGQAIPLQQLQRQGLKLGLPAAFVGSAALERSRSMKSR